MGHHHHDDAEVLCPSCDFGPFQRNAYWTGKLMLAGDFIAEQHYFMEKLRHHNLHLHGSGTVCGLKVVQHDKEECRGRFICVEPGTAIDCCGHEIVLRFKECIDLDTIPALKALKDKNDTDKHKLAICIRFRECETEQVPVLYDECGCSDDRCAPNRVLEAFALDVMVDPTLPAAPTLPAQCGDLWQTSVAGCAHCDAPDCVVLATVTDYVVGKKIVNPLTSGSPPADSIDIDNYKHRDILPSAQLIKAVIDCILKQGPGGGGVGPRGPKGDKGDPGTPVPGASGAPGKDGVGLEAGLTQIVALSWHHDGAGDQLANIQVDQDSRKGFVIAFSQPVFMSSIDADHVFQVLIDEADIDTKTPTWVRCWCPLVGGEVIPVIVPPPQVTARFITSADKTTTTSTSAVAFLLPNEFLETLKQKVAGSQPKFWVVLRCDFVIDKNGCAVDGEFVRHEFPTGNRPAQPVLASKFGSQGGTFESWFQAKLNPG
jgi:hypothetical protein